jgi:hypothetical protein
MTDPDFATGLTVLAAVIRAACATPNCIALMT